MRAIENNKPTISESVVFKGQQDVNITIQYNTIILLFHLISYETFTKYFHKHVQHKHKE